MYRNGFFYNIKSVKVIKSKHEYYYNKGTKCVQQVKFYKVTNIGAQRVAINSLNIEQ